MAVKKERDNMKVWLFKERFAQPTVLKSHQIRITLRFFSKVIDQKPINKSFNLLVHFVEHNVV